VISVATEPTTVQSEPLLVDEATVRIVLAPEKVVKHDKMVPSARNVARG
jgi:hypothetical protein